MNIPAEFDWKHYLFLNPDVAKCGISESIAVTHWTRYGHTENRKYKVDDTSPIKYFDWILYINEHYNKFNKIPICENDVFSYYLNSDQSIPSHSNLYNMPTICIITHNYGGGTETYVSDLIHTHSGFNYVILRCTGNKHVCTLEIPGKWCVNVPYSKIYTILCKFNLKLFLVAHLIGHDIDTIELIFGITTDIIQEKHECKKIPYIMVLVDYYYISGDPAWFDKLPDDKFKMRMLHILKSSDMIICPSTSTKHIYHKYYPTIDIQVFPCEVVDYTCIVPTTPIHYPIKVCAVGTLSEIKGDDRYIQLSEDAIRRKLQMRFYLIGNFHTKTCSHIHVTGSYKSEHEFFNMISSVQPDIILIPGNKFHETYSYITTLVQRCAIPILVPELPIFKERNLHYTGCYYYPPNYSINELNDMIVSLGDSINKATFINKAEIIHKSHPIYSNIFNKYM